MASRDAAPASASGGAGIAAAAAHSSTTTIDTFSGTDLLTTTLAQRRAEYTQRTRDQIAAANGADVLPLGNAFLTGDGSHLLDLSAKSGSAVQSPTFLSLLMNRRKCDPQLVDGLCRSIARFGFEHANAAMDHASGFTPLHALVALCARESAEEDSEDAQEEIERRRHHHTRLVELLLAQPSCTREVVMEQVGGVTCLRRLLSSSPTLAWLPMATLLLEKSDPIGDWHTWLLPRIWIETLAFVEFSLHFLLLPQHDTAWLLASAAADPVAQSSACDQLLPMRVNAPQCQILRLLSELVSQLVDRSRECRADSTAAPTALAALREWIQVQLDEFPLRCLSARLRDDLKSARVSDAQIMGLVHALEQTPYMVDLDETNGAGETLLGRILTIKEPQLRLLEPIIPQLMMRLTPVPPSAMHNARDGPIFRRLVSDACLMQCVQKERDETAAVAAARHPLLREPDRPFARLQRTLIDLTLACDRSTVTDWSDPLIGWFRDLASVLSSHTDHARLVREIIDHIAAHPAAPSEGGRVCTQSGRSFCAYILEYADGARAWLGVHEGSDWYEQASGFQEVMRMSNVVSKSQLVAELPPQVEAWIGAMQLEVEVHLIPDLARIALSFLLVA